MRGSRGHTIPCRGTSTKSRRALVFPSLFVITLLAVSCETPAGPIGGSGRVGSPSAVAFSVDTWFPISPSIFVLGITSDPNGACFDVYDVSGTGYLDNACDGVSWDPPLPVGGIYSYAYGNPMDPLTLIVDTASVEEVIQLDCGASVTRGSAGGCAIALDGYGMTIVDVDWTFTPSDPSYGLAAVEDFNNTDSTWLGDLVVSGIVTANLTWDAGGTDNIVLEGTIEVVDRSGWEMYSRTSANSGQADDCVTAPHATNVSFGWMVGASQCASETHLFSPDPYFGNAGINSAQVSLGPNKGYWYLTSVTTRMDLYTQMHRDFRNDAITYFADSANASMLVSSGSCATLIGTGANISVNAANNCNSNSTAWAAFRAIVWNHEQCHMDLAIAEWQADDIGPDLEKLVRSFNVIDTSVDALQKRHIDIYTESAKLDAGLVGALTLQSIYWRPADGSPVLWANHNVGDYTC